MYKRKLPTYKKVLTDHRSMNLEPRSHHLTTTYMSQVESPRLLGRDPPGLGKAYVGLWPFGSFEVQNLLPESCVTIRSAHDIASGLVGAWLTR
jgi:hypothetical protein